MNFSFFSFNLSISLIWKYRKIHTIIESIIPLFVFLLQLLLVARARPIGAEKSTARQRTENRWREIEGGSERLHFVASIRKVSRSWKIENFLNAFEAFDFELLIWSIGSFGKRLTNKGKRTKITIDLFECGKMIGI